MSKFPARARLDADKSAQPKTRLIAKVKAGNCFGPGSVPDGGYMLEDTEKGERTSLSSEDKESKLYVFEVPIVIRADTFATAWYKLSDLLSKLGFGPQAVAAIMTQTKPREDK